MEMDPVRWAEASVLILTVVGAGIRWAIVRKQARSDKRADERIPRIIQINDQIYRELNSLREDLGASHTIILQAENGSRIVDGGHNLHSSVLFESHSGIEAVYGTWRKQRLDGWYTGMLAKMLTNGSTTISIDTIPTETPLHDVYRARDLSFSQVSFLLSREGSVFYLSCAFKTMETGPKQRERMRVGVNRLRDLLHKRFAHDHFV